MTFGAYLRSLRKKSGISMSKLAGMMDVSVAYLSDVERGARAPLRPARISLARKALGISSFDDRRLRFLAARQNGSLCVDVSSLDDDALERLIHLTEGYE